MTTSKMIESRIKSSLNNYPTEFFYATSYYSSVTNAMSDYKVCQQSIKSCCMPVSRHILKTLQLCKLNVYTRLRRAVNFIRNQTVLRVQKLLFTATSCNCNNSANSLQTASKTSALLVFQHLVHSRLAHASIERRPVTWAAIPVPRYRTRLRRNRQTDWRIDVAHVRYIYTASSK